MKGDFITALERMSSKFLPHSLQCTNSMEGELLLIYCKLATCPLLRIMLYSRTVAVLGVWALQQQSVYSVYLWCITAEHFPTHTWTSLIDFLPAFITRQCIPRISLQRHAWHAGNGCFVCMMSLSNLNYFYSKWELLDYYPNLFSAEICQTCLTHNASLDIHIFLLAVKKL